MIPYFVELVYRYYRDIDMIENTGAARRQSFHSPAFYPPSQHLFRSLDW